MLRKFVLITGFLDIPIGLATWAAAILEPQDTHFGALMTTGAFLMFAGAALMWSTQDMLVRAPIIFWQGFRSTDGVCEHHLHGPKGDRGLLAIRHRRFRRFDRTRVRHRNDETHRRILLPVDDG